MSDYYQPSYIEMARLQTDEEAARRRQQQALQLMQAGYNPVPNANPILSVLASVMSTIKGDSMLKDSDAKISEVLAKKFELQNREDQAKAEAEQRRRQEDWDRELQRIEITAQTGAKYREPKNIDPLSPEGMSAQAQLRRMTAGPGPKASLEEQMWEMLSPEQRQQAAQAKFTQTGSAPPGYRPMPDGSLQAIPGGPADKKNSEAAIGARAAVENSMTNLDRLAAAAKDLKTKPVEKITGIQGQFPNFPGGEAANTAAQLETLKSQVGFGVLQAMRDASKTGGALGSIAVRELEMLQNNLAALDTNQSPEAFKAELQKIADYAEGVKSRSIRAYESEFGQLPKSGPTNPLPSERGGWSIQRVN